MLGRKHVKKNGQMVLAYKGWKDLKNSQKEWIFNQLHLSYQKWHEQTGNSKLSPKEESDLLEQLLNQLSEREISVDLKDVRSQCRSRLRRYETQSLKRNT